MQSINQLLVDNANQKENCEHPDYSVECPIFKAEQAKLKRSIPFFVHSQSCRILKSQKCKQLHCACEL